MLKQFDPMKFIDREFEQELFEELLAFPDAARILAIRDASGMGKSHLLELFRYRCNWKDIPVSLVDLKQLPDQSPMMFVKEIVKDLIDLGVSFPNFNAYESARVSADFDFIRASVYLEGASFKEARDIRISGTMTNVNHADRVQVHTQTRTELTVEQREKAEDVCVRSFLDDVRTYCAAQPIVLLVDSFERCGERLFQWLHRPFLRNYFFDTAKRPAKLLLVIAGQTVPHFALHWPPDVCTRTVKSVETLKRWSREHIEQCLSVQNVPYEEQDIELFHQLMERAHATPLQVIQLMRQKIGQR